MCYQIEVAVPTFPSLHRSPERKCRLKDTYKAASQAAERDQCVAGWTCRGGDGTSTEKWQPVREFRLNRPIPSHRHGQRLSNYVTADSSLLQEAWSFFCFCFWIFIFNLNKKKKPKNGSGEMGAKVDPVVSFGCYGAPSQTRLDLNPFSFSFFFWGGDATSLPLSLSVGRWNHLQLQGRNNGSGCEGDNGITSVTDELCEPPSNSWISPCWRHFPVNCFIGRLLFFLHVGFVG